MVAGASGSGKSRLARMAGDHVAQVSLDDFYHDHDHPGMPQRLGIPDWDHVSTWDLQGAVEALTALVRDGSCELPVYDISTSSRTGTRELDVRDRQVVVAEGIFAPEAYRAARQAGLPAQAIWLDRPRATNFSRRLARDLKEHRKPPAILVRRGVGLYRREPELRAAALRAGFRPMGMRAALAHLRGLTA